MPDPGSPPASTPPGAWDRLVARFGKGGAILLLILAALFAASITYGIKAEKPWGRTVQKRLDKQQPFTPKEYAIMGSWWGAVTNAALLALLLATAGKWMPGRVQGSGFEIERSDAAENQEPGRLGPRCIWLGLVITVGLSAWLRAPRLSHSLWNDEEYAMRRFAHGAWEPQKNGAWEFEPVTWTDTLFENRNGNNHVLNSLVTRLALDAWRAGAGAPRDAFNEAALRLPAFIAGLLTVAMIFLLGRRAGGPLAGLAAALLVALCPWHIRYAVEAKGYSFMLLFVCTAIYGLIRALEENRLRWWLVFAMSEAAFLLSFAGSIYVAAALNLFAAVELLMKRRTAQLWTLAGCNLIAAIPVVQWMLPSVPQLLSYLRSEESLHLDLGWPWLRDFLSGLIIGFQFENPLPAEHAGTSWLMETGAHAWLAPLAWMAGALLVLGIGCALVQGTAARLAIAAPMLAVVTAYAHNFLAGSPMVVWYLLYAIVPASLAVPLALGKLTSRMRWVTPLVMVAFLLAWAAAIRGPAQRLRTNARQPMREAVARIRAQTPDALSGVFGVSDRQVLSYDPRVRVLESETGLRELLAKRAVEHRPLFVYFCGYYESKKRRPDLMSALESGLKPSPGAPGDTAAEFQLVAEFPGTEEMFSYRVYRANSGAQGR